MFVCRHVHVHVHVSCMLIHVYVHVHVHVHCIMCMLQGCNSLFAELLSVSMHQLLSFCQVHEGYC